MKEKKRKCRKMFGSKEKKIEKFILKGQWDKISKKYLNADVETRLLLARQCEKSKDDEVNNILSVLIRDVDERVQIAAIKSMGVTGKDHETAQLQWILSNTPESKKEVIAAAKEALSMVKGRR